MKRISRYRLMFLIPLAALSATIVKAQQCSYDTNGRREVPAANENIVMRSRTMRILKGTVTNPNGDPIAGVSLALFRIAPETDDGKMFVGSTDAGKDGKYCFGSLPKGRYVLFIGSAGFKRMEFGIKMVPADDRFGDGKLDVMLELGT